jgi:hypothetical protein
LAARALLKVTVQGDGAIEDSGGPGRVVAGKRDLRQVVEGGLLLGRVAGGSDALERCGGCWQIAEMDLADSGVKLRSEGVGPGRGTRLSAVSAVRQSPPE